MTTAIHPEVLGLLQSLSGWVLGGKCAEAAAALGRWGETQSEFIPLAAGASAIVGLPTGIEFHKKGLLKLLTANEMTPAFAAVSSDEEAGRMAQNFRMEGRWGLLGSDEALKRLAEGVFAWDPRVIRAVFEGVVEAGGLGDLALAIERLHGRLPGRVYEAARARLHALTKEFLKSDLFEKLSSAGEEKEVRSIVASKEIASAEARRFILSDHTPGNLRKFCLTLGVRFFLQKEFSNLPSSGCGPFLTHLLNSGERGVTFPSGPADLSVSLFTAHLARAADLVFEGLTHNGPILNLALPQTPLVIGANPNDLLFRTVDEWKEVGLLGKGQESGHAVDLLAGTLNIASNLDATAKQASKNFEIVLQLFPNHFMTLINRAHIVRDDAEALRPLRDRVKKLDPDSAWVPLFDAYVASAEGKDGDSLTAFEAFFEKCLRDGSEELGDAVRTAVPDGFLKVAIDDYALISLKEQNTQWAAVVLADLQDYHSLEIRKHAQNAIAGLMVGKKGM